MNKTYRGGRIKPEWYRWSPQESEIMIAEIQQLVGNGLWLPIVIHPVLGSECCPSRTKSQGWFTIHSHSCRRIASSKSLSALMEVYLDTSHIVHNHTSSYPSYLPCSILFITHARHTCFLLEDFFLITLPLITHTHTTPAWGEICM
jgi:hypothetical protein